MTLTQLKIIIPSATEELLKHLNDGFKQFEINTPRRQACFLGQVVHESLGFQLLRESLNYSTAGLLKTFHKYFNAAQAVDYAHKPEVIANRVYANRMGNGPEESGDGWKYRGRGGIQATGKEMYAKLSIALDQDFLNHPELLETLEWAVKSAMWIFAVEKGCLPLADNMNIKVISKKINGGYIGLRERLALTLKAYSVLKV